MSAVLVVGGAGYIGTHILVELMAAGHEVVVIDNLCNSSATAIRRVEEISGKSVEMHEIDCRDLKKLKAFFVESRGRFSSVIHLAALKAVGESVQKPLEYYENNLAGALNLFRCMKDEGPKACVFSSSATVYGVPDIVPLTEECKTSATNPYGKTKLYIEEILRDLCVSDPEWKVINLRYFNPTGAHPSGKMGEDPAGIPNNLMPYVAKVAVGKLKELTVFGNDYKTKDGTGVRDYIHVVDLAAGHVAAVQKLQNVQGEIVVNLGTGQGYSVLEMVKAMEGACGKEIPYTVGPRRAGDVDAVFASTAKAKELLGWEAKLGLKEMCDDLWRWQNANPDGYRPAPL